MNRIFIIGYRSYNITSPTIKKITLAGEYLQDVPNRNSIEEIFQEFDKEILCKILSCLIQGNLSLVKELSLGTKDELVEAVSVMYSDMEKDTRDIYTAVESISNIIAMPK